MIQAFLIGFVCLQSSNSAQTELFQNLMCTPDSFHRERSPSLPREAFLHLIFWRNFRRNKKVWQTTHRAVILSEVCRRFRLRRFFHRVILSLSKSECNEDRMARSAVRDLGGKSSTPFFALRAQKCAQNDTGRRSRTDLARQTLRNFL